MSGAVPGCYVKWGGSFLGTAHRVGQISHSPSPRERVRPSPPGEIVSPQRRRSDMTLCLLLRSAVELAGDIRHERCTVLSVSEALHQNDQHKWPGRKNDPGIVVNLGDLAGLVRHARACGKPGGNAVM